MSEAPQSLNTQLANAVATVARANDYLARASEEAGKSRREEAAARIAVNEAQDQFDSLVALVKKTAPRDTVWRQMRGQPV